jgi:hypothetical protein
MKDERKAIGFVSSFILGGEIRGMDSRAVRYAGWAAYISGVVSFVGFVALILFFALEVPQASADPQAPHIWGPLSDIAGPATMLPLLVVILALHEVERGRARVLSQIAVGIGVVGALAVTVLQVLLIVRVLPFEQEVGPVVFATALVGVWLVLANHLGRVQQILPSRLAWVGIVAGGAQVLYPVMFQLLGGSRFDENVGSNYLVLTISSLIFLVSYVGFPVWALWLGRIWSRQRAAARAEVAYAG